MLQWFLSRLLHFYSEVGCDHTVGTKWWTSYLYLATLHSTIFCFLQNQVIVNQLKRQGEEINKLGESLETKKASESKLERQVREAQRKYADLETRMKEDLMMARIRDAENTQCVAELTQKISSLEYKVRGTFFNYVDKIFATFDPLSSTPGWHLRRNSFTAAVKLGDKERFDKEQIVV